MKINDRLKKIGDLVEANSFCLDVGCDHAFLDIYLVQRGENIKAIASDVKEGPLNHARENINKYHLEDKIECRLGNGLDTYSDEVDTIIISGLGGRSMIGIFKSHLEVLKKVNTIILSPNNYQEDVKRFLCKHHFYLSNEELVKEGKFIYQILVFSRGKRRYSRREYFFGPVLLEKKGKLFDEYYKRELVSREILIKVLPKNYRWKKFLVKKEIQMLKEEINKGSMSNSVGETKTYDK